MQSHKWLTDYGKSHVLGMHAGSQRAGVKDGLKKGRAQQNDQCLENFRKPEGNWQETDIGWLSNPFCF